MITIRAATPDDKNFIYSTFLKGVYYGSDWMSAIAKEVFFVNYSPFLDRLLQRSNVLVTVACLQEDPNTMLGYAIYEADILHFVYVKQPWRLQGIAKQMLAGSEISKVTHITKPGNAIRIKKGLTFNPWLL